MRYKLLRPSTSLAFSSERRACTIRYCSARPRAFSRPGVPFADIPACTERQCRGVHGFLWTPLPSLNVGLCHPISMPLSASLTGRPTPLGGRPSTSVLCPGFNDCSQHGRSGSMGRPCLSLAVWLCHQISMPLSALMFCRPGQFPVGFPFADIPADTALR